jgi:zeaxanthin glucosyltransferase
MPTVLFVMLPFPSHYMASFGFARLWEQRGYTAVFTGPPHLRQLIEQQGFGFVELVNTPTYVIRSLRAFVGLWLQTVADAGATRRRYREWYGCVQAIRQVVADYAPTLIFLDEHLSHYALYLADVPATVAVVNTKLPTRQHPNIPPLTSNYVPTRSALSALWCRVLWRGHRLHRWFETAKQRWAFCGKDDAYFDRRLARRQGIEVSDWFATDNAFYDRLTNVPTVILAPRSMEYDWFRPLPNEFFLNPAPDRDESAYLTDAYLTLKERLRPRQQTGELQVIYAAFGTLTGANAGPIRVFLPKLIEAVRQQPNWFLLLATGDLPTGSLPNVPNVAYLPFVPQLDALTWADAMVTHGGTTTLKECLMAGVPMLSYPLISQIDHKGNSAHLIDKKWGLVGSMLRDNSDRMNQKLQVILKYELPDFLPDSAFPSSLLTTLSVSVLDSTESHKSIVLLKPTSI